MLNYEAIKKVARKHGLKVGDLLAMAPANDPFYTGTPRDIEMGEWFYYEVWVAGGFSSGTHIRRAHYWAVSVGNVHMPKPIGQFKDKDTGIFAETSTLYMNSIEAWKYMTQASKMARYLGLIQLDEMVDMKNPDPAINAKLFTEVKPSWSLVVDDVGDPYQSIEMWTWKDLQPALLEVWVEKTTINDVLEPICSNLGANLVTFAGEASITAVSDLAYRIEEASKPARIFYISDLDPAGNSMSKAVARKLEWVMAQRGLDHDVKLKSLALTPEQAIAYSLPRTPIKPGERRAATFEEAFGEGGVELDAMEAVRPGELGRIVRNEMLPYISQEAIREAEAAKEAVKELIDEAVRNVSSKYEEHIAKLAQMTKELREIDDGDVDLSVVQMPEPVELDVDEDDEEWLFSSDRGYTTQIGYYKRHSRKPTYF